jgi:hypothetical protein
MSDLKLSVNFALTAWIRLDGVTGEQVLFSKTDKTHEVFMKWSVNAGKLKLTLLKFQDSTNKATSAKNGLTTLTQKDWHFVAVKLKIDTTDAKSSFVTFKVDGSTDAELEFSD